VHVNEHSVEIDRPSSKVFPYLVESGQRLRWMGALAESEQVTEGEPGLGTRFRDVFEDHGQRVEIDAEVVEWQPTERLAIRLGASSFQSTGTHELRESDGRTTVTTRMETEYTSRMARLMAGVITRHAQTRLEEDLVRLKQLVESES